MATINTQYTPKLYKTTGNMSVAEWENARRNSLGGSDMSVILGCSPYKTTALDIYYQKIGKKAIAPPSQTQNIIFSAGHFLENMVANLFSFRTGYEAYEIKAMFEHPFHPHLRGNIDRFYRKKGEKNPLGFLECKTTSEYLAPEWNDNKIPIHYRVQIATYMSILNMNSCKIACLFIPESLRWVAGILYQMRFVFEKFSKNVLGDIYDQLNSIKDPALEPYIPMIMSAFGGEMLVPEEFIAECSEAINNKFVIRDFERDKNLEGLILSESDKFWKNYVEKRVEPPLDNEKGANAIATLQKYVPSFVAPTPIILPDGEELAEAATNIEQLKQRKSALTAKVKSIDSQIEKLSVPFIEALKGADKGVFTVDGKETYVSYTANERLSVKRADIDRLKNTHPDVFDEIVTKSRTKPQLKIG